MGVIWTKGTGWKPTKSATIMAPIEEHSNEWNLKHGIGCKLCGDEDNHDGEGCSGIHVTATGTKLEQGVYELPTGEIYLVKWNRENSHLYAKRLVPISGERLTASGEHKPFDFEYEAGAIFRIKPENRMGEARAKELIVKYKHCIACGRRLKDATSVERGIGPVCITYFRK